MNTIQKAPRKRINRFAHLLSKEYDLSYAVARDICREFGHNVNSAVNAINKIAGQVSAADAQLSTIDSINLLF